MFPQAHVLNIWSAAGSTVPSDSVNFRRWSQPEKGTFECVLKVRPSLQALLVLYFLS